MRKDVKLGFTIGGVLLAVLIVYVLIISSGPQQKNSSDISLAKAPSTAGHDPGGAGEAQQPGPGGAVKDNAEQKPAGDAATIDPFKTSIPGTTDEKPAASGAANSAADEHDAWSRALNTGTIATKEKTPPLLLTETPTPAGGGNSSVAAGSEDPGTPNSSNASNSSNDATGMTGGTEKVNGAGGTLASQILGSTADSPATQPASPLAPGSAARTHVVQPGESFSTIAAAVYGNPSYYPHLLRANPNVDPKKLRPGMTINIPDPAQVIARHSAGEGASAPSSSSPANTGGGTSASNEANHSIDERSQYRVQSGDSLYKISQKLYGRADRVDRLYELNKDLIGASPSHLRVGMVLKLPEPPTSVASTAR